MGNPPNPNCTGPNPDVDLPDVILDPPYHKLIPEKKNLWSRGPLQEGFYFHLGGWVVNQTCSLNWCLKVILIVNPHSAVSQQT